MTELVSKLFPVGKPGPIMAFPRLWQMALVLGLFLLPVLSPAQAAEEPHVRVLEIEGVVEFSPPGDPRRWHRCATNELLYADYQLRTGPRSRTLLRLQDLSEIPLGPHSHLVILPSEDEGTIFNFLKGVLYWFRRDDPKDHRIKTPTVSCASRSTEYSLVVQEDGATTVTLFDGQVALNNAQGNLTLQSGEAALVLPGEEPRRTPFLEASQALQWRLYYPAVLDLNDLNLPPALEALLEDSLAAYAQGDLHQALKHYPAGRHPTDPAEAIYLAALLLVVGEVEEAEILLEPILSQTDADPVAEAIRELARAMIKLIRAVKHEQAEPSGSSAGSAATTTQWMAASYDLQSRGNLAAARWAAEEATRQSSRFGFAWSRLAELEFGHGLSRDALDHVQQSLELTPGNAQAWALQGFILSSQNKLDEAAASFDQALALDGALANAWLGRGLCRIRKGQTREGLRDLQSASALEPQRALLRSYLGKAFQELGRLDLAELELERAAAIDPADPTPWLYTALLNQQRNRINEAIRDLETSQSLNDQRYLYRSRLLLDQDQAVRGANLAGIFQDAGLDDVSTREAARALNQDYANYSAHLFLANSFNRQRDPNQVNLRFESAWLSEYLIANLLAPVHAGTLSPLVTQNEYSHLFERDRLGISSVNEYRSNGDWVTATTQYGRSGNSAYALEGVYRNRNGYRPNHDLEDLTLSLRLKQELTPHDSFYFQATYYDYESGDVTQYYDPRTAQRSLRIKENQEPLLLLGYHHEWTPGSHTLFLASRLHDDLQVRNPDHPFPAFGRNGAGDFLTQFQPSSAPLSYDSEFEAYTMEGQQIWQANRHTLIAGGRIQSGHFETRSDLGPGSAQSMVGPLASDPVGQRARPDLQRYALYAYEHFQLTELLLLHAGLTYDYLEYPVNHRFSPVATGETHTDKLSPKAGFILTPHEQTTVRGAYTRSLGGVSFDQSFRLEPTQVGGFNQTYRSLIPESAAGALSAADFETFGLALDQKFRHGTYFGIQTEWLRSQANQQIGVIDFFSLPGVPNVPSSTRANLEYDELILLVSLNQLIGDMGAVGIRYRLSEASLDQKFSGTQGLLDGNVEATLHQVWLYALVNHEAGFFGQADAIWNQQSNRGYSPDIPGDDFWQFNVHAGYRFPRRKVEWRLSLLNLADQDYRLNPLNLTSELPRERTLATSLRLSF